MTFPVYNSTPVSVCPECNCVSNCCECTEEYCCPGCGYEVCQCQDIEVELEHNCTCGAVIPQWTSWCDKCLDDVDLDAHEEKKRKRMLDELESDEYWENK